MLSLTQTWPRLANSSNRICSRALKLCRPQLSSWPQQQANLLSVPAASNALNHGSEEQAIQELAKLSKKACSVHLSGFGSSFTRSLIAVHSKQREPCRVLIWQRGPSPDLQLPWFRSRPFRQHPSARRLLGSASPRSHCMIEQLECICIHFASDCLHAWLSMISENDVSLTQHRLFGSALKFCKRKELFDNF